MSINVFPLALARVLLLMSALAAPTAAGHVDVYYHETETQGAYLSFTTGPAQRCYTFRCLTDRVAWVEWRNMQQVSIVVLYDQDWCMGNARGRIGTSGYFYSAEFGGTEPVRSLMVWESGSYPTRGLLDACFFDEDERRSANASLVNATRSGSGGNSSASSDHIVVVVGDAFGED